jgi:isopentenyl-diphosphate delta-isomerase
VELVDEKGVAIGALSVRDAHSGAGALHRVVSQSCLPMATDASLLQQRSPAKRRFAGRWSNTCCGHPAPGQPLVEAAQIRLAEEIGVFDVPLQGVGHLRLQRGGPGQRTRGAGVSTMCWSAATRDTPTELDADEVYAVRWPLF